MFLNIISSLEIFEKKFGSCGICDQSGMTSPVHVILFTGHDKKTNLIKEGQAGQVATGYNEKYLIFYIFKHGSFKNIFNPFYP